GDALRNELLGRHVLAELNVEVLQIPPSDTATPPHWLIEKYAELAFEAVVPSSPDLLPLALGLRNRLWPRATVVAPLLDAAQAARLAHVPRVTGLLKHDVVTHNLALMFDLLPATRHIAVVSVGLDRDWIRPNWRSALQPW